MSGIRHSVPKKFVTEIENKGREMDIHQYGQTHSLEEIQYGDITRHYREKKHSSVWLIDF